MSQRSDGVMVAGARSHRRSGPRGPHYGKGATARTAFRRGARAFQPRMAKTTARPTTSGQNWLNTRTRPAKDNTVLSKRDNGARQHPIYAADTATMPTTPQKAADRKALHVKPMNSNAGV